MTETHPFGAKIRQAQAAINPILAKWNEYGAGDRPRPPVPLPLIDELRAEVAKRIDPLIDEINEHFTEELPADVGAFVLASIRVEYTSSCHRHLPPL